MSNDYDIARIYKDMEQEIVSSMQRNLSGHVREEKAVGFDYPQWQAEKLRSLRQYQIENAKIINSYTEGLPTKVKAILQDELKQGSLQEIEKFKEALAAGYKSATVMNESFFRINARKVNALINSVNNDFKKANQACLRYADDAYRKAIFKSEMYVANGVFTEKKAIEKAVEDFEKQGLHCIEYADGSRRDIADYADMAIKTASQRAHLMGEGEMRKKIGETLIKISKHGGTCPLCAKWEGKVLIDDVYSNGTAEDGPYPLLSEAMAAGLYHPRCRHGCNTYYPEIEDIWDENTSDIKPKDLNENIDSDIIINDEKVNYPSGRGQIEEKIEDKSSFVADELNISKEQADDYVDAVEVFTDPLGTFTEIRKFQRGEAYDDFIGDGFIEKISDDVESYIEKSPKWNGGTTYRGIAMSDDELNALTVGGRINMGGTSSWSDQEYIANEFSLRSPSQHRPNPVIYHCGTQSIGTGIKHLSMVEDECEVLCSKEAQYKILKIEQDENYITHIFLEEV